MVEGKIVSSTMQTSAKFRDFARVYLCSFKCIIFKLGKLTNFKALFLEMDITELVLIKTWKKKYWFMFSYSISAPIALQ